MIMRRNIDWGSISALLLILIPIVAAGCYQPLPFTPTRTEIGLGKGVGKIFFAGGFDALGNGSAVVDVLDPASGDVFMLQLPVRRGRISVSSIGTKVLFAGGQLFLGQNPRYYDKIDVYDTESGVMQTMGLDIGQISQGITSLVVGSRIILFSSRSTTAYIIDPTNNSHETLELPLRPNAATFGDGRAFFVGRASTNLVVNILNVGNMSWATPREVTWNPTVIGAVYYRTSLVLLSYTNLLNIDVNNAARQLYESTFSERNLAAYTLIEQELYLLGPGFVTVYLPYARLVRFRSSALFLLSGQTVENNGIIYCAGTSGNFFPHTAVQFDTRALLRTVVPVDYRIGIGYIYTAFGRVFRFLGRNGLIYYHNLQTNQQGVFNYATQFSIAPTGMFHTGRRLLVFTSVYGQYLMFDADTETWTRHSMPFINIYNVGAALVESSESYAVLRNQTNLFVLDIDTNEWTILAALQSAPVKIVGDNIVLLEGATMRVYNMNTHQWRIGLEFNSTLTHALVVVHTSTILITGIGEGDDYRKLHVYNVDTREYRVEVIMSRRRMKTLVHGDYVTFTGGYAPSGRNDISNRVDMYNVRTATWKSSTLPPNLSFYSPPLVELAASDTSIFIARENRVDVVDIESGTNRPVLVPISEPRSVRVVGSKVVIYSRRTPERIIGVYETTTGESFSFTYNGGGDREFYVTENFIVASTFSDSVKAMELTTFTSRMKDVHLFIGESAHFNASVQGGIVSSYWQHGDNRLENQAEFSLSLDHVTLQSEGTYSIDVLDQCSQRMTQRARLDIHRAPVITEPLEVSLIMCHDVASIAVSATGQQVKFNWTLESESYVTESSSVKVSGRSFPCNSVHEFCVVAHNPSGSASSCNQVRVVGHDLVFDGPRPEIAPPPVWLSSSEVTLTVKLMDEECTEHQWYKNGVAMNVTGTDASGIRVKIDPLIAAASFHVEAVCGSSTLESKPFKFTNVSSWTAVAVVLTVIGGTIGLAGLVVVGFFVRRRMIASKKHEIELENLLTQAKSETLNVEGAIPIVQSTTWEWRPSDEFTYKPIDKMPYVIDYSALTSLNKDAVKVGVWNQSIIEVSLRDTKSTSKGGGMRERLIDSTYIDIYAPQSPKYEIKVEPSSIELDPRRVTYITVSTTMRMTSKCKICLIVVNERDKIYSVIEFKMSSGMSTWIDLDEIESNGEYLGGGGFGSVTLGTYRGQDVAVKKLLSQYLTDEMKIEFDREVTLMKDLRHPNIVQFVGASNVKSNLAIVIEFAPLGSIASVMEKQKLSTAMKLTMLLETAKALQFLHTNGIIHRDIKPQNVLVFSLEPRAPVHVKLTDFGTARFISDDPTTITKNVGTISFMAPEALGRNPRIDKSADVYSFAMLMWSMLCEQTPFSEFKWDSDIEAHVKAGNRLPFLDNGSISAAMVKLIEDCWHHEPAARPSMASVVQRLAAINQ